MSDTAESVESKREDSDQVKYGWASTKVAIFIIQTSYLLVLAVPLVLFVWFPAWIPVALGPIPIGVPWFGALGAVIISLWGLTEHKDDWNGKWKYWHWSRPVVGAALASVTVLIFKAGILAVGAGGATPPQEGSIPIAAPTANTNLLYYVIAFVVGYREETFRDLIKKVADLILTPGAAAPGPAVTALNPVSGPAAGGTKVIIAGTGLTGASAVWFGTNTAPYAVKSETCIEATSPAAQVKGKVPVVVHAPGGRAAVGEFTYE